MEPYFEISKDGKYRRYTQGDRHERDDGRSFEISTNGANNVYAAVLGGKGETMVLGNLNMSREDFIDGMLGLFPELRRA
jgi:hypothetical protein